MSVIWATKTTLRATGADAGQQFQRSIGLRTRRDLSTRLTILASTAELEGRYNVIYGSAIMCHLPDPLNLNVYLGSLAQDALFSSVVNTEARLVC
jgi:hypothetical protein